MLVYICVHDTRRLMTVFILTSLLVKRVYIYTYGTRKGGIWYSWHHPCPAICLISGSSSLWLISCIYLFDLFYTQTQTPISLPSTHHLIWKSVHLISYICFFPFVIQIYQKIVFFFFLINNIFHVQEQNLTKS